MNEKRFIQEFLDETSCGYSFKEKNFREHQETNEFYAALEKAMQATENIRLDNYTPLEECIMYYYETELLTKEPKPNLYIKIRQEYRKFQSRQISAFGYYMFLIQTALDNKIQANKQMYDSIYRIYGHLCMKYALPKISYWNNYDGVQSDYTENDEEEKRKMRIRNRDIKSQIRTIQTYIGNQEFILPLANNRELLENCTKHILYYALKFLVREELYNLYPDKNRSKQPKLITWLNIFFHDRGSYSFEESPAHENISVYDKKAFFREYSFPRNSRMIERIEKNADGKKAIYIVGKELLLDNCELIETDFNLFDDESLFYFVVTAYTEDFPKKFFQLKTDREKNQFQESVEIMLTCAEKILTDFDKAYMYFNEVTGSEDEIQAQKEENIQNNRKGKTE